MKKTFTVIAFSLVATGTANAMAVLPSTSREMGVLPIVKADVVKKTVVRRPVHRVFKKTIVRH